MALFSLRSPKTLSSWTPCPRSARRASPRRSPRFPPPGAWPPRSPWPWASARIPWPATTPVPPRIRPSASATWKGCAAPRVLRPASSPRARPAGWPSPCPPGSRTTPRPLRSAPCLAAYAFRKYRTNGTAPADIEQIVHPVHDAAVARARVLAEAMTLVRDLVNTAPADMVPADLAAAAEQTAAASGLGVQVLDENELAKDGYGGILAVGMGSVHPPRLVRLEYTHPDAAGTVVFV